MPQPNDALLPPTPDPALAVARASASEPTSELRTNLTPEQASWAERERVRLLYGAVPIASLALLVLAGVLGALLWQELSQPWLFAWLVALAVLALVRHGIYQAYLAKAPAANAPEEWERRLLIAVVGMAALWALMGVLLLPMREPFYLLVVLLALALVSAGAVVEYAASRRVFLSFVLLTLLPASVALLATGTARLAVLGLSLIGLLVLINFVHAKVHAALVSAIALRALNDELRTDLENAQRESTRMRSALSLETTARMRAVLAEQQALQKLRLHIDGTPLGVVEWDQQFRVTEWNASAERIFGHRRADALGKNGLELIVPPSAREQVARVWRQLMHAAGGTRSTNVNVTAEGREILCEWYNTPLEDSERGIIGVASLVQDVTERKQSEEMVFHMAHHDALTDLPNRRLLNDRIEQAILHARRLQRFVAVLYVDLDRFKLINDTLGHATGDDVLREVARRLRNCVRPGDTVSREGGDEFVVALCDLARAEDATAVTDKVRHELSRAFVSDGQEFHVTPSIGVSFFPTDAQSAEMLLRHADSAMYFAKESGRNTTRIFTGDLDAMIATRLAFETRLRKGLERNEFTLHYQPIIEVATLRMQSAEALLRWKEGQRDEAIYPQQFVSIAEEMGIIAPLGNWVLQTACAQRAAWNRRGIERMPICINISPRQFMARGLVDTIKQALETQQVTPDALILEITESMVMRNPERAVEILHELRAMGIGLAIDDFGTGNSSLAHLKRFPVHTVKIDAAFVNGLPHDNDDASITRAILAMAASLGLKCVAEGVETAAQFEFLRAHGCDAVQGFLFSEARPADEFEQQLRRATFSIASDGFSSRAR